MSQNRKAWLALAVGMVAAGASAQGVPPPAAASSAARMTLEQLAQSVAMPGSAGSNPPPPPQSVPRTQPATATAPAAPALELVEILGTPRQPRARIALHGVTYSVSSNRPTLGTSAWTLVKIDVETRSAVVRRGSDRQPRTLRLSLGRQQDAQPAPSAPGDR
jgi:hypothetical protein